MRRRLPATGALAAVLVLLGGSAALADHEGRGEPGDEGSVFELFGSAQDDVDPQNPANEVISIDTTGGKIGGATRVVRAPIESLDDQVELKYLFVGRTCGGGSPRITLLVSTDGDDHDAEVIAHGHVGPFPVFTGCTPGVWRYEDLTDDQPRWEVNPSSVLPPGSSFVVPWSVLETALAGSEVIRGLIVDDSGGFFPAAAGCGYYELVSIGAGTLSDEDDTGGHEPDVPNSC